MTVGLITLLIIAFVRLAGWKLSVLASEGEETSMGKTLQYAALFGSFVLDTIGAIGINVMGNPLPA